MALRERHLQNFRPRKPETTYEEAIDRMDEDWVRFYEEMDFPIRDLLTGRRWLIRFKDSSQLEVMLGGRWLRPGTCCIDIGTSWVDGFVAGVGLFVDAFQVGAHFTSSTGHLTLGEESGRGASVILPGATVGGLHTPKFHGYQTSRAGVILCFQLVQELIGVEFLQHLYFGEFSFVVHFRW